MMLRLVLITSTALTRKELAPVATSCNTLTMVTADAAMKDMVSIQVDQSTSSLFQRLESQSKPSTQLLLSSHTAFRMTSDKISSPMELKTLTHAPITSKK